MYNFKNQYEENYTFDNIIDPWKNQHQNEKIKSSRLSILSTYKKADNLLISPKFSIKKKSEIVVIGFKIYQSLSLELQSKTHVILKPRDIFRYKHGLKKILKNFTFDVKIYKKVYNKIINNINFDFSEVEKKLQILRPKILIISSTIDIVQSIWAFYAKKIGVNVVCIQHGLFSSFNSPHALERNIVDYYISLGESQSKLIERIIPKNKHKLLFDNSFFYHKIPKEKSLNICLIGNDYENYGTEGIDRKKKTLKVYDELIKNLKNCTPYQINFYYKKHPSENWLGKIADNVSFIKDKNLEIIHFYFGVSSTLLMELASQHFCSIQICSKELEIDRYENFGFCKSLDLEKIENDWVNLLNIDKIKIPCLKKKNLVKILEEILNENKKSEYL